jgi:hypothetical protein
MGTMTLLDLRKLAIKCQLARETMDDPLRTYYAWMNDGLMQRFNVGKARFTARLNQLMSRAPVIRCPWAHVGKNH